MTVPKLIKKYPTFYWTLKVPHCKTARIQSQINPLQVLYSVSVRWIVILSSKLYPGLPSGAFPSGFPHSFKKHNYPSLFALILRDVITWICRWVVHITKLLTLQLSPVPSYFHFLDPSTFLITLSSNTLIHYSSVNLRDQVLHPYRQQTLQFCIYLTVSTKGNFQKICRKNVVHIRHPITN
jgi:hypothetical protein